MTDEDPSKKGSEGEKTEEKSTRDEFIEFLTSTGRIKPALARSLFEQGLDSHEKLASGDEDYFKTFKRVGPATAEALMELAKEKVVDVKKALEGDELREVLLGIPRVGKAQVESMFSTGFDTGRAIVDGGVEGLQSVKGIGKAKAEAIIQAVEPFVPIVEATIEIEDATGHADEGEEKPEEEGFFSRIVKKIKGIFKKDDADEPEEKAEDEPPAVEEEPAEEEKPAEDESTEEKSEEAVEEEPPAEEEPAEEPPEEEKPADEEDVAEEPPVEEIPDDEAEAVEKPGQEENAEEEPVTDEAPETDKEEVEEKKGFFAKIAGFFKKDKEEASEEEQPEEEKPAEEEKPEEEAPEEKSEEEPPVEEKVEEEKPDEEPPVEEEKVPIEDFHDIPGISSAVADKLYDAGYSSMEELREAVWDDLVLIEGIGEKTAKKIVDAVSNC